MANMNAATFIGHSECYGVDKAEVKEKLEWLMTSQCRRISILTQLIETEDNLPHYLA